MRKGRSYRHAGLRWLQRVAAQPSRSCRHWPFGKSGTGYGIVRLDGKSKPAHRVLCEIVNGPAPTNGHHAAHVCGKKTCCNPRHLIWATRAENEAHKLDHGTATIGAQNGRAKITEAQAKDIRARARSGENVMAMAREFGLSDSTIYRIKTGKRWAFLDTAPQDR